MNLDYSLFPNLDGNLGQNKVKIPDGIVVTWPDGDALVGNFVYKNGKISALVDTKALIANDSKTTTIPYDYFDVTFESIKEGDMTFIQGERCKYFTVSYVTIEESNGGDDNGGSGSTPDSGDLTYTDLESLTLTASEFIDTQMVPPSDLLFEIDHKFVSAPTDSTAFENVIMCFSQGDNYYGEGVNKHAVSGQYYNLLHPYSVGDWGAVYSQPPSIDFNRHILSRRVESLKNPCPAGTGALYFEKGDNYTNYWGALQFDFPFGEGMEDFTEQLMSAFKSKLPILTETLLINNKGGNIISGCHITHYSIKLYSGTYDDSSLIADMRPVQASNGQKGLYCSVRKIFMPVQTATGTASTTYSLRNNSTTIEDIVRMIAEEKGISLES